MNEKEVNLHEGSFLKDLSNLIKIRKGVKRQNTFCWCPKCGDDLCSSKSLVSDEDLVKYRCSKCGKISYWNFDCICPFLIK